MFIRLKKVKSVLKRMLYIFDQERVEFEIDELFGVPEDLESAIHRPSFWSGVHSVHSILDPICKCIGMMETASPDFEKMAEKWNGS